MGPSMRSMRLPMSVRFSGAGQSTLAILRPSFLRRVHGGQHHAGVGAAAAEVAPQPGARLFQRGIGVIADKSGAGHDETRGAETALLGVVLDERLLHFVAPVRGA